MFKEFDLSNLENSKDLKKQELNIKISTFADKT